MAFDPTPSRIERRDATTPDCHRPVHLAKRSSKRTVRPSVPRCKLSGGRCAICTAVLNPCSAIDSVSNCHGLSIIHQPDRRGFLEEILPLGIRCVATEKRPVYLIGPDAPAVRSALSGCVKRRVSVQPSCGISLGGSCGRDCARSSPSRRLQPTSRRSRQLHPHPSPARASRRHVVATQSAPTDVPVSRPLCHQASPPAVWVTSETGVSQPSTLPNRGGFGRGTRRRRGQSVKAGPSVNAVAAARLDAAGSSLSGS